VEYRPELVAALRQMNDYAAEICAELAIPTLNLMSQLTPRNIPSRPPIPAAQLIRNLQMMLGRRLDYDQLRDAGGFSFTFDGIHLTEGGAQRVADEVARFLRANGVHA
jgi:lysophospholipase L1-like esterase